ncbi:bifunctional nuclease domain-containing protein [uncultured Acetobacteroides sp.]|uniref:bifunctional nuclease family protein n=1 Tax=uncultured Acetobacteroides sp. TaxID=1760811 RepID=UPI0029F55E7B|nr:bifunctional nuclease domain-containing protein [uncultured Acetobacteroides sp.]
MQKVKLNVLGISYSQTQSGAYALVLSEEGGQRRIPIIIGGFEAQSIAIHLEGLTPPRPLTHDLFLSFSKLFNIELLEVNIYRLEDGVFYSQLVCFNGEKEEVIDSRTSDAIALALRFKCPIFTTPDIVDRAGVYIEEEEGETEESADSGEAVFEEHSTFDESEFKSLNIDSLNTLLKEAVDLEDYERASHIRDEIQRRKDENL